MLVLKVFVGLHRIVQLQLLQCYWSGLNLDYPDIEWFSLETNRDHSVVLLRLHPSNAFWTLVDYDAYSISSKGFLPAVVDIMVL